MKIQTIHQDIKYLKILINSGNKKDIQKHLSVCLPEYNVKLLKELPPLELAKLNELEIF